MMRCHGGQHRSMGDCVIHGRRRNLERLHHTSFASRQREQRHTALDSIVLSSWSWSKTGLRIKVLHLCVASVRCICVLHLYNACVCTSCAMHLCMCMLCRASVYMHAVPCICAYAHMHAVPCICACMLCHASAHACRAMHLCICMHAPVHACRAMRLCICKLRHASVHMHAGPYVSVHACRAVYLARPCIPLCVPTYLHTRMRSHKHRIQVCVSICMEQWLCL